MCVPAPRGPRCDAPAGDEFGCRAAGQSGRADRSCCRSPRAASYPRASQLEPRGPKRNPDVGNPGRAAARTRVRRRLVHRQLFRWPGAPDVRHQRHALPRPQRRPGPERTFAAIVSTAFAEPEFLAAGGTVASLPEPARPAAALPRERAAGERTRRGRRRANAPAHRRDLAGRHPRPAVIATIAGATTVYSTRAYDRVAAADGALVPPAGPAVSVGEPAELAVSRDALPIVACSLNGHPQTA